MIKVEVSVMSRLGNDGDLSGGAQTEVFVLTDVTGILHLQYATMNKK
jgi:hypothetical protein